MGNLCIHRSNHRAHRRYNQHCHQDFVRLQVFYAQGPYPFHTLYFVRGCQKNLVLKAHNGIRVQSQSNQRYLISLFISFDDL